MLKLPTRLVPTGKGNHSYSAYDIIKALHERAGVGNDYLESIKNDKDKMREPDP